MKRPFLILGGGAVTAVGFSVDQTCAAIRAAIAGFAESDFFQNSLEPVPLVAAHVPLGPPPQEDPIFDRLVRMATHALRECLDSTHIEPSRTALLLGLREPFREHPDLDGNDDAFLPAIEQALDLQFHSDSTVLPEGNAAALKGLLRARSLLDAARVDTCIVGGVDSYLNPYDLRLFEETYRLKREGVAQGFIAGEGAAFVVTTSRTLGREQIARGEILGVGLANEDPGVTVLSDGDPTGKGLQRALEATVNDAQRPESSVTFRVSDLNGEYYRGMESVIAQSRFYRASRERLDIWLPASCVGEIGAAVGALLVIMASVGMAKGYAPGPIAMCEASSDTGLRAGCLLSGPPAR
jgi:hypothetical protein